MSGNEIQSRYCFITPTGGSVAVSLIADEELVCGADFKLYNSTKERLLDQMKLSVENGAHVLKRFKVPPNEMGGAVLVWKVLCCSRDPKIYQGRVDVKLFQDGAKCNLTPPVVYQLDNIAPCSINSPLSVSGALLFMLKKTV